MRSLTTRVPWAWPIVVQSSEALRVVMADGIFVPSAIRKQLLPDALVPLEAALGQLTRWTSTHPPHSKFYMNERVTVRKRHTLRRASPRPENIVTADVLFDIYSLLAAQCLMKSWRSVQLAGGLLSALGTWNLTAAVAMVRALVETASAWAMESRDVASVWRRLKNTSMQSVEDVIRLRHELDRATIQVVWGTRISQTVRRSEKFKRTNILTLIQKAEKQCSRPTLFEHYEILCYAVHPSWGAGECFWNGCCWMVGCRRRRNQNWLAPLGSPCFLRCVVSAKHEN
jgi:hypothetical protein